MGAGVQESAPEAGSPFVAAVAHALRQKGWEVHARVGVSAYRIDLAILDPDFPGRYLAGVECDSDIYHSSAFCQERDKIRKDVLSSLGWTLIRIWSTDWWAHAGRALDALQEALKSCGQHVPPALPGK